MDTPGDHGRMVEVGNDGLSRPGPVVGFVHPQGMNVSEYPAREGETHNDQHANGNRQLRTAVDILRQPPLQAQVCQEAPNR